jgi:hypothetical protein
VNSRTETQEAAQSAEDSQASSGRRSRHRYPLHLTLSGRVVGKCLPIAGETVNISSEGLFFAATESIPRDSQIAVQIEWPVRSGSGKPMSLVGLGTIVRSTGNLVAARILRYSLDQSQIQSGGPPEFAAGSAARSMGEE